MVQSHVLIVDHDINLRDSLRKTFIEKDFVCHCEENVDNAIALLKQLIVEVAILELEEALKNGHYILKFIKDRAPETLILILANNSTVKSAVKALNEGADDYFVKPINTKELLNYITSKKKTNEVSTKRSALNNGQEKEYNFSHIIGKSAALKQVFDMVKRVANSTSNVLITGKSGTGKELIARAIHENSPRKNAPFVPINCGALPETLFESELFGFKKGTFTGANQDKDGVFKSASGGTLFLDEVGEIPVHVQVKLLRAIETKEIKPLGSSNPIHVNVRILSATNKDLLKEVEEGNFREDLYYRLNIVEIHLPSLCERREDIPLLVNHFIEKYSHELKRKVAGVDEETMKILMNHPWKGEVRELENIIERAVLLCDSDYLTIDNIKGATVEDSMIGGHFSPPLKQAVREFEKYHIQKILEQVGYDKSKASEILEIGLSSLYRKIEELSIEC